MLNPVFRWTSKKRKGRSRTGREVMKNGRKYSKSRGYKIKGSKFQGLSCNFYLSIQIDKQIERERIYSHNYAKKLLNRAKFSQKNKPRFPTRDSNAETRCKCTSPNIIPKNINNL